MKYFISAGEASGDLHASQLIKALNEIDRDARFAFLGGDKMAAQAGVDPLIHINEMSVMGFGEVLRALPRIMGHLKKAKNHIATWRPDALILVDYPSFNLKLAKFAHGLGIKVFWYISPKVWVWKEHRVKAMKKYIDRLYCILPFEVDYFRNRHGWEVMYVGNPSAEEVREKLTASDISASQFLHDHGIKTNKPVVALLPGSRVKEIKSNLPIMIEAVKGFDGYTPVIAAVSGIDRGLYEGYAQGLPLVTDATFDLLQVASAALVTSGTATLETALMKVPQVMLYRHSGSKLTYRLFRGLLKVKYFSLPNLINDNETIKELVMHFCTPQAVAVEFSRIIPGGPDNNRQQSEYQQLIDRLGHTRPSVAVARNIYSTIETSPLSCSTPSR